MSACWYGRHSVTPMLFLPVLSNASIVELDLSMNMFSGTVPSVVCDPLASREASVTMDCGYPHPEIECSCCTTCHSQPNETLLEFLTRASLPIDGGAALSDLASPQYAAYSFMDSNNDYAIYNPNRTIQRYVMATLGATSGGPSIDNFFLEGSECIGYAGGPSVDDNFYVDVTCDGATDEVVEIDLDDVPYNCNIPPEIGLLSGLSTLKVEVTRSFCARRSNFSCRLQRTG